MNCPSIIEKVLKTMNNEVLKEEVSDGVFDTMEEANRCCL
jgi:propionaldehyde dehydrogenase